MPEYYIEIGRELAFCIKLGLIVYLFVDFVAPLISMLYQAKEAEQHTEGVV